jgi:hypothetical protein
MCEIRKPTTLKRRYICGANLSITLKTTALPMVWRPHPMQLKTREEAILVTSSVEKHHHHHLGNLAAALMLYQKSQ